MDTLNNQMKKELFPRWLELFNFMGIMMLGFVMVIVYAEFMSPALSNYSQFIRYFISTFFCLGLISFMITLINIFVAREFKKSQGDKRNE